MGYGPPLSRREILSTISVLGSGSLLLPVHALGGEGPDTRARGVIRGAKTHAGYTVFAHTSPVYYRVQGTSFRRAEAAGALVDEIEESMRFIRKSYKFASEADRALALGRFEQGRSFYARLIA